MKPGIKNFASALLLALTLWGGYEYARFTMGSGPSEAVGEAEENLEKSFHTTDRSATASEVLLPETCAGCHPSAPHRKNEKYRAFLNMHTISMDCGVCHLDGPGVVKAQNGDEQFPRIEARASGSGADGALAPLAHEEGKHVTPAKIKFNARGPDCKSCHRRGSKFLRDVAGYGQYRRRVLEDLQVLVLLED